MSKTVGNRPRPGVGESSGASASAAPTWWVWLAAWPVTVIFAFYIVGLLGSLLRRRSSGSQAGTPQPEP